MTRIHNFFVLFSNFSLFFLLLRWVFLSFAITSCRYFETYCSFHLLIAVLTLIHSVHIYGINNNKTTFLCPNVNLFLEYFLPIATIGSRFEWIIYGHQSIYLASFTDWLYFKFNWSNKNQALKWPCGHHTSITLVLPKGFRDRLEICRYTTNQTIDSTNALFHNGNQRGK